MWAHKNHEQIIISVQEKIDILSEKLERESYIGDKPNLDYIEFDATGKNSKVKCKSELDKYHYFFSWTDYRSNLVL